MIGTGLQVIVVNYESCWRLETELTRWKPDLIVCDESSKIKNPQAKCSKALHHLGKISSYNLILTGTPVTNSPLDFFSQYKFLDDSIFGQSFYSFRNYYAVMGGYQQHQIIGYKHLTELVSKAHAIAYRIRIDEAVELPEFVDEIHPVKLEPKAQKIYDGISKDSYAELASGEITTRNVLSKASEIIAIALSQVGYKEKASNQNLDDPVANAGGANWTKYALDLASAGYYNGNKNGYAWCDVFVDWCFFKAYGPTEGQRIQCQTGDLGAGCTYSMQYYQQHGRFDKTCQAAKGICRNQTSADFSCRRKSARRHQNRRILSESGQLGKRRAFTGTMAETT